jgi:hypothetical protein
VSTFIHGTAWKEDDDEKRSGHRYLPPRVASPTPAYFVQVN